MDRYYSYINKLSKLKKCNMKNNSTKIVFLFAILFLAAIGSLVHGFNIGQANAQGISDSNSTSDFYSNKDIFVKSEPQGFGIYDEKNSTSFVQGEDIILYIEPVGYEYKNITGDNGEGLYSINFSADFILTNSDGTIIGGQEDVPVTEILSHYKNKEVIIPFTISQSSPLPTGNYGIDYIISDENSGKSFEINKNITIE